ncbi:hypothetical protein HFN89_05515 [Rhizobium laguerreae]|nr:hypothetical protein [Rhizobium laguerreae]
MPHCSTIDPRHAAAHRRVESLATENGFDFDAFKHPAVAYLKKLDNVEPWQARFARLPFLNERTPTKATSIVKEIERWHVIADRNKDDMGEGWRSSTTCRPS